MWLRFAADWLDAGSTFQLEIQLLLAIIISTCISFGRGSQENVPLHPVVVGQAEPYQRVGSRKAHRNGYKERSLKTRVGELKLKKPQFREISFQTKVFDRYS